MHSTPIYFSRLIPAVLLFGSLACVRETAGHQEEHVEKPDKQVQRLIQKLEQEIEGKLNHLSEVIGLARNRTTV